MKGFGGLFLLLLIVTAAVMYLSCSSKRSTASLPGVVSLGRTKIMILTVKSRKLKEDNIDNFDEDIPVHLEDYRPIDPVPSSKASIKHGPIQHGTPLMPFIPRAPPPPTQPYIPRPSLSPSQPRHGGFP